MKRRRKQKRVKLIIFIILLILGILLAIVISNEKVDNFKECVKAGNPVMESYPRQCVDNGNTFVEEKDIKPY